MGRKLKYDIPGPDCRRSPEDFRTRGGEALFAPDLVPPFRLVIEIGFGRGEFIVALAERDPETAFLGIEVSFKRVLKLARRVAASATRNLRLVHAVAEEVVYDSLPPASVDDFWINFPDPWPRDSQAKHRLVQGGTVGSQDVVSAAGKFHAAFDVEHAELGHELDVVLGLEVEVR